MYSYLYLYLFIKETVIYIDRIASREFLDQFSSSIQVCMFTNSLLIQTRERHSFQHKHSNVITNDYFIMSLSHLFMILRRYYNQQEFQSQRNLSFQTPFFIIIKSKTNKIKSLEKNGHQVLFRGFLNETSFGEYESPSKLHTFSIATQLTQNLLSSVLDRQIPHNFI